MGTPAQIVEQAIASGQARGNANRQEKTDEQRQAELGNIMQAGLSPDEQAEAIRTLYAKDPSKLKQHVENLFGRLKGQQPQATPDAYAAQSATATEAPLQAGGGTPAPVAPGSEAPVNQRHISKRKPSRSRDHSDARYGSNPSHKQTARPDTLRRDDPRTAATKRDSSDCEASMGFLGGLFTGSNPTLTGDIGNAGDIMQFGTDLGKKNLNQASGFDSSLLSGDPNAIGKLLGPEFSTIQKQGQQQLDTNSEFHNRSGGTNASNQTNIDSQRAEVEKLISELTGKALTNETGIGEHALDTGLSANAQQAQESALRQQEQQQSLLGGLLSGGIGALAGSAASFLPFGG